MFMMGKKEPWPRTHANGVKYVHKISNQDAQFRHLLTPIAHAAFNAQIPSSFIKTLFPKEIARGEHFMTSKKDDLVRA